ncbi:hypothetical protein [Nostoc sp. CMAA1605]|nr:hypothetical protein [Nostoc sp. CMAA1605]
MMMMSDGGAIAIAQFTALAMTYRRRLRHRCVFFLSARRYAFA